MVLGVIIRTVNANIINISHNRVSAGRSTVCNYCTIFIFFCAIRGMNIFNFPLGLSDLSIISSLISNETAAVGAAVFFLLHRVQFPYKPAGGT